MKILFVSYGRGWGFLEDTWNQLFKPLGAKHFRISGSKSYPSMLTRLALKKYDVVWCEESGFIPTITWYLLRKTPPLRIYRNRNAKIISRLHFHNCDEYLSIKHWRAVENIAESDVVVSVSQYWKDAIKNILPFLNLNLATLHNGVDTEKFVSNRGVQEDQSIFYLASTYHRKRLHLLIQAMNFLPNFKLVVGGPCKPFNVSVERKLADIDVPSVCNGSKEYWDWCHKLAEPNKERILWKGFLTEEEKVREYQKCSIFVLPSTIESWGVVFMEAMACEKLVLATYSGGTPEFVPANELLPLDVSPKQLAERITMVDGNENIGKLNRAIAEKYDWSNIRKELECVLSMALQDRQ